MTEKNSSQVRPVLSNDKELSSDDLINAAYPELKRMARRQLRGESGQAFQTPELVNGTGMRWLNGRQSARPTHIGMAIMTTAIRNVLVY